MCCTEGLVIRDSVLTTFSFGFSPISQPSSSTLPLTHHTQRTMNTPIITRHYSESKGLIEQ